MSDALTANLESFNRQLEKANVMVDKTFGTKLRYTALQMLRSIVLNTRWKYGHARGNWQVCINIDTTTERDKNDISGESTIAEGRARIDSLRNNGVGEVIFISNAVKYIFKLEELDGMVERAITEASMMWD